MVLLDDDLPEPLPMGQETSKALKEYLPSKKIYFSWTTTQNFFLIPEMVAIMALPVQGHPCKSHVLT